MALVITRRPGESFFIGDDVEVMIISIRGSQVKIGISAPADVQVDREEIRQRKLLEVKEDNVGNKRR